MIKNSSFLLLILSISIGLSLLIPSNAYAQQSIVVNSTTPCFLNYTASYRILEDCGANDDYMSWLLLGWEYISGGYFSVIFVSIIIVAVYAKFHQAIYAIFIGIMFLPFSYFAFPAVFLSWAVLMAFVGIGILIWYTIIKQTKDY